MINNDVTEDDIQGRGLWQSKISLGCRIPTVLQKIAQRNFVTNNVTTVPVVTSYRNIVTSNIINDKKYIKKKGRE